MKSSRCQWVERELVFKNGIADLVPTAGALRHSAHKWVGLPNVPLQLVSCGNDPLVADADLAGAAPIEFRIFAATTWVRLTN